MASNGVSSCHAMPITADTSDALMRMALLGSAGGSAFFMGNVHGDHALDRLIPSCPFIVHHDGGMGVQGEDKGRL
jgi:hypothetical protein